MTINLTNLNPGDSITPKAFDWKDLKKGMGFVRITAISISLNFISIGLSNEYIFLRIDEDKKESYTAFQTPSDYLTRAPARDVEVEE